MAHSKRDVIDPETTKMLTYSSSIKSGTHGEVYQKQLAQVLLLRLSRERKTFQLAYEMTSAEKFDDVVLYDKEAKQWIFLQSKHADGKDSKIDLNGLLPKTHQEKGGFSLYKYFYTYMVVRDRFKGKINFVLFTNKKLDEKIKAVEGYLSIKDRDVDEYLRFTSEGATHKVLTLTESATQSIIEYANKDLYSLKTAIKELFTRGNITRELPKYKVYLQDILEYSGNYQIRFKRTFNDSLVFIAKLYKVLQPELQNFEPIDKPSELDIEEVEYEYPNYPPVEDRDLEHLIDAIKNVFFTGFVSDCLKKYENLLGLILTTTAHGKLAFKDTFNCDLIWKAELYRLLKAELSDMQKKVTTKEKLFDMKDSRNSNHSVLIYAEAPDVRQFFALLTLSVHQPDELESFIVNEFHLWLRTWLRPDILGKLIDDDDKIAVKDLDDYFVATLKSEQGNTKPYLDQDFVTSYFEHLRYKITQQCPELNDKNQLYISRVIMFEKEDIDTLEVLQASQFDENTKSEPDRSSGRLNPLHYNTARNRLEMHDEISFSDRFYEEITDSQFAANFRKRFAHYQCLVLTADPGIGKTELLQYVALEHQKLTSGAVFLFYLNRIQDFKGVLGNESSLEVLKPALSKKNFELIQNVLQNISNDHITILFDGYDEIHEKNRNRINNLLKLLLKSKCIQVVISARNHEKKPLLNFFQKYKFNVGYFTLKPFNSENIIEYLARSWSENFKYDVTSKFSTYSKFLIEKFYCLCRVPLMVKMMGKIYKQSFQNFKETSMIDEASEMSFLEKEFSEVDHIYEIYIQNCLQVKIEDACHRIGKTDSNNQFFDGFCLDHQLLALAFLDVNELKFIFKNPKYMKRWDYIQSCHKNQFEKSILIKFVGGKVVFSHHSYAEYFAANFLWDDFIYLKNIVKHVLSSFTGIRKFFIKIVEKNIELFLSKIAQETSFDSKDVVYWACENNAVELLQYALSKTFLLRPKKTKMLHFAIKNGSDKICSYLMDICDVHPDVKYGGELAPLHSAIIYGHRNLVQLLLRKGANINIRNTEGWSALHYAVHNKQMSISIILIENGIDVNSSNKNKWNALHISCNNGDADMTRMLIQKGAQLDIQTSEGKTPLYLATAGGHTEVVVFLIEHLSKTNPLHSIIDYAFKIAVRYGHNSVQEMLINEFPIHACAEDINDSLIHIAAWEGITKKVKRLIKDGSNVNAPNRTWLTPLHISASAGHRPVVELLLDEGANVNVIDERKWTPLHLACQNGRKEVVKILLKEKANIDAMDHDNRTPLFFACQNGHEDVVKILIKRGANIDASTQDKWTVLHLSAFQGNYWIVGLLLDKGANVNAVEIRNRTPLHFACGNGHKEVLNVLIRANANINAMDHDNLTPLDLAYQNGWTELVVTLLRIGANFARYEILVQQRTRNSNVQNLQDSI